MNTKLIMLVLVASFLLYCYCYALPKLELLHHHHRRSYWNSRFIIIDGVKRHRVTQQQRHHQQQQQQRMGVVCTFLSGSNNNDGKNQDAIPLSALNTEQIDVKHNDSFLPQKILVSESSFDGIRTGKGLYVDKTKSIYQAILEPNQKYNFFVRPRRFGKSLLCSTLSNLFQGKSREDLFKGLWIHESKVWDFEKEEHPVLHLDMSSVAGQSSTVETFENDVKEMLKDVALVNNISFEASETASISTFFRKLILKMKMKHNKPVVVIIDEYDKPILDLIKEPERMEAVRKSLQSFYAVLKPQESNLRLVFITGLYRFTEMSMFSTLNNLKDISFDINAGTLVGYTESEVRTFFSKHIAALKTELNAQDDEDVMDRLRKKYNGYRFGLSISSGKVSESIYNPFSLNNAFDSLQLKDTWTVSGSAFMLFEKLLEEGSHYQTLLSISLDELQTSYSPSDLTLASLMYYGGYSTIDSYDAKTGEVRLKVPNESIEKYLAEDYFKSIFTQPKLVDFNNKADEAVALLTETPVSEMESKIKEIEKKFDEVVSFFDYSMLNSEGNFQMMMDTIFKSRFDLVSSQMVTKDGRMDTVIFGHTRVFVIEFKFNKSSKEAIDQIHRKEYYMKPDIMGSKLPVMLLGINLQKEEGTKNVRIDISYELFRGSK